MITEIEDYFIRGCGRCDRFDTPECSTKRWSEGLAALRTICLDAGLSEHVKWGQPCYMHANRNIVIIGALRGGFRLVFFNAALMKDPEGILARRGPNTRHADMFSFTDNTQVDAMESTIRLYLQEAMGYAARSIKAPGTVREIELPDELREALDADPVFAEAFHNLTPGRRRSYIVNLSGARKRETRVARIARFRSRIIEGKGATER